MKIIRTSVRTSPKGGEAITIVSNIEVTVASRATENNGKFSGLYPSLVFRALIGDFLKKIATNENNNREER